MSRTLTADEWDSVYELSQKQTLVGIAFAGIERLPGSQLPPPKRIRQWSVKAERIKERNIKLSKATASVSKYFVDNGFRCIILKGQGNMAYYPPHLKNLRTPGDIDVWLWPAGNDKSKDSSHDIRKTVDFCLSRKKGEYVYYHNLDFPIIKDIPVEVHYRPSWLYNPLRNRKLQQWFTAYKKTDQDVEYDGYTIPTTEFNIIFQLLHLYKHIFEEGIGMRQLLDYYMVLKNNPRNHWPEISRFGLSRFAGAVMYVLKLVFEDSNENWMICKPNECEGKKLISEIMQSGNFGQFDERYNWNDVTNGSMHYRGLPYAIARFRHNYRFLCSYPSEVLCEPLFRIYNKLWVKLHLWKYE